MNDAGNIIYEAYEVANDGPIEIVLDEVQTHYSLCSLEINIISERLQKKLKLNLKRFNQYYKQTFWTKDLIIFASSGKKNDSKFKRNVLSL